MEEVLAAIIDFQAAIIGAIVGAVVTLMVAFIRGYLELLKKRGRNLESSDLQKIKEETKALYPPKPPSTIIM